MTIELPHSIARTAVRQAEMPSLLRSRLLGAIVALGVAATMAIALPDQASASARADHVERAIVRKINAVRVRRGLPVLRPSRRLSRSARAHSLEMAFGRFFSHASANGSGWSTRVWRYVRARSIGETIAWYHGSRRGQAAQVVHSWMCSPVHRALLLNPSFRRLGVGSGTRSGAGAVTFVTADFSSAR